MQINRYTLTLALLVTTAVGARAQRPVVGVVRRSSLDSLARQFPSKPLIRVSGSRTDSIPATKDTVTLRPGELLIKETGRVPTIDRTLATPHFDLPEGVTAVRATGGSTMFTVAFEPQGLAYAPDGVFVGTVHVGLNDSLRPDSTIKLARPVHILLSAPAGDAEFDSTDLELSHTNLPFTPVKLRVRDTGQDSVHVTIRAASGRDFAFSVVLLRPALSIVPSPWSISGLGLEQTRLTISVPSVGGPTTQSVTVSGTKSSPDSGTLTIAQGSSRSTMLRSRGVGADTIWAKAPPFRPGYTVVRYDFPVFFLLAAVLGGAFGGAARVLGVTSGVAEADEGTYTRSIVRGLVIGLIAAVLYAAGVNVLGINVPLGVGEAGVFSTAVLGVLFGLRRPGGAVTTLAGEAE